MLGDMRNMPSGTYADMPKQIKIEFFRLRLHNGLFMPQDSLERRNMLLDCMGANLRFTRKSHRGAGAWLTGEAQKLDETRACFQFGKTSPEERDCYDEIAKKFIGKTVEKIDHILICMDVNFQLVGRAMSDNMNNGLVVTFGSIGAPAGFVRRLVDAHAVKDFSNACALPNQNLSADNLYKALSGWAEKFGARQSAAGVKADGDIKNGKKACCRYGQIYAVFLAGDVGGAVPKMRQLLCVLGVAIFGLAMRKNGRGLRPPAPVEQRPSPLNIRP